MTEFETVVGKCHNDADIEARGNQLMQEVELSALLITRSERGMTLLQRDQSPIHLPTLAREVFDVTGAGDTVISLLAASLAAGMPLPQATEMANLAAGIVVSKLGTATVSTQELNEALQEEQRIEGGIVSEEQLIAQVRAAQQRGEKVVMTNGCFDILHSGHVSYLQQARKLGDHLIVAVNDDASVKRLKGETRPVNTLESRMHVLAALGCVDWVVPFSEDTPERLICQVLPDLLVKGGDYHPDEIAGGRCVTEQGGDVKVLSFIEGHSTTDIIQAIQKR
jgi:D-beta-D-heptose 7-phosphate kinase/D-beta-D-heptose 1-phosphate adenosyltransferase